VPVPPEGKDLKLTLSGTGPARGAAWQESSSGINTDGAGAAGAIGGGTDGATGVGARSLRPQSKRRSARRRAWS
jgi:hypothetical protein